MKEKKQILRTCVVSKEVCEKKDLIRVVRTPEGNVIVDTKGKANGRGAYISKTLKALEICKKKKCLDRALEVNVPDSVYDEIKKIIDGE